MMLFGRVLGPIQKGYSIAKMNVTTQDQGTGFWYGSSAGASSLYGSTQTEAIYEPKVLTVVEMAPQEW